MIFLWLSQNILTLVCNNGSLKSSTDRFFVGTYVWFTRYYDLNDFFSGSMILLDLRLWENLFKIMFTYKNSTVLLLLRVRICVGGSAAATPGPWSFIFNNFFGTKK